MTKVIITSTNVYYSKNDTDPTAASQTLSPPSCLPSGEASLSPFSRRGLQLRPPSLHCWVSPTRSSLPPAFLQARPPSRRGLLAASLPELLGLPHQILPFSRRGLPPGEASLRPPSLHCCIVRANWGLAGQHGNNGHPVRQRHTIWSLSSTETRTILACWFQRAENLKPLKGRALGFESRPTMGGGHYSSVVVAQAFPQREGTLRLAKRWLGFIHTSTTRQTRRCHRARC